MFTGIIASLGIVQKVTPLGADMRLSICPTVDEAFTNIVDGESIAVNGLCLTVEKHAHTTFSVYASKQTLARSTLQTMRQGTCVNLERALRLCDRLGGHLVTGHVDCLATIQRIRAQGESKEITLTFPSQHAKEIVEKGSVALDGISLTVNSVENTTFTVNIIPETVKNTTAKDWTQGRTLHLETDILAKYVAKHCQQPTASLTQDFLARHGFF
ncbi:MAG: riboflavin synthase [Desulfovibrio sp.]|nr:riboflavin synthase [Desulfovibrio sp.]